MEIVLYVCLLADPKQCKEERLPQIIETTNPMRCATISARYMAMWMVEHPAWKLIGWKCDRPGFRSL